MAHDQGEPIFNAPAVIMAMLAVLALVHAGREFMSETQDAWVVLTLAFVPARYGELAAQWPGAPWAAPASFVTHALLHGDLMHLGVNSAWLLAVGTPVARRMDAARFVAFTALCAAGGALMFLAINPNLQAPMVGASGAISGLMAAVFRLMYAADDSEGWRQLRDDPAHAPRLSLKATFTNRRSLTAILVWVALNFVFAFALSGVISMGSIAWEAHLGGFFAGLLAFDLFDRGEATDGAEAA